MKSKAVLNKSPDEDQGSEAIFGFDFQCHCISRRCLEMIRSHEVHEIVCEYHEDFTELCVVNPPAFCQVKKRESADTVTIAVLIDAIHKLLKKAQYRDIGALVIYGHGRPSMFGEYSLADLIALLDRPEKERDAVWDDDIRIFEAHFSQLLPELDGETISKGLRLLKICLGMPHPDAIVSDNGNLAAQIIFQVWGVHIDFSVAEKAYDALYRRVCEASKKPKQPRSVKRITVANAREIIHSVLQEEKLLAEDMRTVFDTHTKLENGGLTHEKYLIYALQTRMDARQVKFELNLSSSEWQYFKSEIDVAWEDFQGNQQILLGAKLWRELLNILMQLGSEWSRNANNAALSPHFAEGVFFDMLAICEADLVV
jgi:hypothetical protein